MLHPSIQALKDFLKPKYTSSPDQEVFARLSVEIEEFAELYPYEHDDSKDILPGWCADDAMTAAQMHHEKTLSYEDACRVLAYASDKFDANIGIAWDILQVHIDTLLERQEITLLDWTDEDVVEDEEMQVAAIDAIRQRRLNRPLNIATEN
jgi:hypothetical protein